MTGDHCRVCPAGLVALLEWRAATPEQRAVWKSQGRARAARSDMCSRCHERLRKSGDLTKYATSTRRRGGDVADMSTDSGWLCCVRCGHAELHADGMCRDCVESVALLGETERWVA